MRKSELRRKREAEILSKLDKLGIGTAKQLKGVNAGDLGKSSERNTLRVLREMESDGLVDSKRVDVKMFVCSGGGFGHWEHTLMRNDFLISKGWFASSRMEIPIRSRGNIVLRADAGVLIEGEWLLIEVDRKRKKKDNIQKIEKYKELNVLGQLLVVCYEGRADFWRNQGVSVYPR